MNADRLMNADSHGMGSVMRTMVAVALALVAGCRGGGAQAGAGERAAPPEVVQALKTPDTPDRIIYAPPVNLAKRPADTSRTSKPRGPAAH